MTVLPHSVQGEVDIDIVSRFCIKCQGRPQVVKAMADIHRLLFQIADDSPCIANGEYNVRDIIDMIAQFRINIVHLARVVWLEAVGVESACIEIVAKP